LSPIMSIADVIGQLHRNSAFIEHKSNQMFSKKRFSIKNLFYKSNFIFLLAL